MLTLQQVQAKFPNFDWETYKSELYHKDANTYILQIVNKSMTWIWSIDGDILGFVAYANSVEEAKQRIG